MGDIFQEIPKTHTRKYQICVNFLKNYPLNSEQYAEEYRIELELIEREQREEEYQRELREFKLSRMPR